MTSTQHPMDHFVHVADLHFWKVVRNPFRMMNKRFLGNLTVMLRRRREFIQERAEPFADAVAATGAKHVLLTGDFSSTSLPGEFAAARKFVEGLRDRGMTIHLMPGNHDVYTFESVRKGRFEEYFKEFLPPEGYPALARLEHGTPLIMVPTVCPRYVSASGLVTDDAVARTKALLDECATPAIVAAHYPILPHTDGYSSHPLRRLENAEALRDALVDSGKRILYVAGHCHRFSYTRDAECDTLAYLTTAAFFKTHDGAEGEFCEVSMGPDGFDIKRHVKRAEWQVERVG